MTQTKEDKKRLLSNFFSLSSLQAANMILPLMTLPYLVRVLGVDNFGLINLALSIIMLFNILVSFGFELSATKEISINRENHQKVSEIFVNVLTIKIILFTVSLAILMTLINTVDTLKTDAILYLVTFGLVFGNMLFPTWFYQGMENMKYITYINVTSKAIFTLLIFIFVQDENDYLLVPLLNAAGTILGAIFSLWLVFKLYKVNLQLPNISQLMKQLSLSYHFFFSRVANDGARHYAVTIIGMSFGTTIVGYYSIVEKLFYAFMSIGGVVSQTIYPYMCRTENITFYRKIFLTVMSASLLILMPTYIFHEELLEFVFNINNETFFMIFLIVFSGAIFSIASTLLGFPLLAAFGYAKEANNSLIYSSIIYVAYITIMITLKMNIFVVASSIALYGLLTLLFRIYYLNKFNISKLGKKI